MTYYVLIELGATHARTHARARLTNCFRGLNKYVSNRLLRQRLLSTAAEDNDDVDDGEPWLIVYLAIRFAFMLPVDVLMSVTSPCDEIS